MPDVSSAVLDRLIQLVQAGAIPQAAADITSLVSQAKAVPGIDKETVKALNLLAKRASELEKRGMSLLRPEAETRAQAERGLARETLAERRLRRRPTLKLIGEERARRAGERITRIREAPRVAELRTQEKRISDILRQSPRRPISVDSVRASITAIPDDLPGAKETKASLHAELEGKVTAAQARTRSDLRRMDIRDPAAVDIALRRVSETAHHLTPVREAETLRLVEGAQKVANRMPLVLKEAGLRMVPGAGEAGRTVERTGRPFLGRLLGGAGLAETGQALSEVERLKTTDPKQALAMLETATQPAVKGPRARAMKGGGIAALLLLPMLLGKMGGGQQQMSPMMQLQLLTQMAQMKQNEQLAGSLVSSRGAQSQRNLAQADLLRMQAMLAAAGGQGRASSVI